MGITRARGPAVSIRASRIFWGGSMNAVAWAVLLVLAVPITAPADEPPATGPCCVRYPLPLPTDPDLFAPGQPFKLVDFRYHVSDTEASAAAHALEARFRVRDWGYLGAAFAGDSRTALLQLHRLELSVSETNRSWDIEGAYRLPRVLVEARAERLAQATSSTEGPGWRLRPTLSVRALRDLELIVSATGDTATPYDHFGRAASLGFLWQPSARADVSGFYEHARVANETKYENTRDTGSLATVLQLGSTELDADARMDDIAGRFPRTDWDTGLGARVPITPRLLFEAGARTRFETDLRAHEYRAAVTRFARRFYLPHTGRAAELGAALARRATALGDNERKTYDDENRRLQRERLSLSPHARELAGDMAEIYRAQVEERAVPTLGLELVDREDTLPGTSSQTLHALVGIPWPPAPPWATSDEAVPFLRLDLSREKRISGSGFPALRYTAVLTAALNREIDLTASWSHADPTRLDIVRGIPPLTTLELSFVYAFGR
jgi:hypothetical protein